MAPNAANASLCRLPLSFYFVGNNWGRPAAARCHLEWQEALQKHSKKLIKVTQKLDFETLSTTITMLLSAAATKKMKARERRINLAYTEMRLKEGWTQLERENPREASALRQKQQLYSLQ